MKSKITKIQNILMKGIAIIVSAMMTVTPVSYAATSLNDNGDFNLSIIDQILYGKVGATAKEIEKYFAEGHTTLYISSEVQLRALAEYVNSAHKDTPTDTCNGDHSCYGKEIILTKNIELSKEEWNPIGKALTTTATETSGNNNTGSSSAVTPSEPDGEGAIVNEELEDNSELGEYVPDENEEENTGIEIHTEDDEAIATGLFNSSEEIIVTSTAFEGTFDGNGYTISNLSYSKDNKTYNELINIGLFGVTGKNAKIKNLITNNFNINIPWEEKDLYLKEQTNKLYSAHYWDVGNIVGYNQGLIENCINNSDIYGIYKVGGISGYSSGNIKNCKNTGMVKGYATVGGIVGYSGNAIIENCINTANISGKGRCGGIVGYLTDGKINNCRNKGNIKGGYIAGGIVAQAMNSTISSANNYDSVDGDEYIGGILGYADKSLITEVLNNGEETKSIFGTQIHTGGIVGYINKSVLNRAINKMPVRGYSAVGGIAGKIVKCNVYYVYNMDSLRTDGTANFDVIGVEKVGGLVGTSAESSLRRSGTTAEVLGVTKCIGGAVGFVYNGTKYTDEIWGINKIASLGSVRLDIDNWTYTSRTNGTYNNSENPVIKTLTSTSICFGVSNIIGYIDANTESETVISNNYIFGNVVGMNGTGSAVGIIAGSVGKVTVSGIIRDERYTYISSKVKTSTDNREFEIKLKGKDENGQNIETASYNVYQTNKTTTHNKSDAKNLDYGLVYTDLICGYYKNLNNSSYIASSFYSKADLGNKYQDKLFTEPYEDDTVKNGVYGVEYVKAPNASDCYYDFKAQLTMQDTSNNVVMPIVNPDDELEKPVIGSTIDENAIGKAATKNVTGSVSNYSINYKLYKNNTEINTETFMKKGDKLKVTATINAPLVNVIDISSNLTRFTTETAPTLSLKNGNTLIATIAPKTVSNVTTSSTETTFTYEYEITDETTSNEKINKVSLNKVGTIYVVGTTSQITDSSFGESETMDILFDDVAPQVSTEMYVEQPLETNRYTAGKEILIKVTTNERIYGNYVLPELRVRFSKSGIGKYISSKDANVGYAKIKSSEIKVDGKTEWIYSYIVQEGDEGNVIVEYTKGTIIDRAGNTTYLQDIYAVSSSSTEFKGTNQFGKDIVINNIGFYKDEDCTQEISLNRYQVGDIYVKVELDDALYTGIREVINSENAPKLYFNGNLGTEVVSVKDGNTIVYKYDKTSVTNITLIDYVTLKNEGVKLYYGQSTIADGKGINVNSIYQIDVDNIYLDPNNLYNNLSGNGIYADTTLPTVDITAYKVDSLPTGNTAVNGEKIENDITNADIIRYRFRFSENVIGFSEDDVTVNFGTKSSVGLKKVNDRIYDLYVETNVEKENTKDVQVIVEQNAVQDLVYQGNVRRENTITVDKKSPKLESYTVREENGNIIVEAVYDEEISEATASTLNIQVGGIQGKGNVEREIQGNKVIYTYKKAGEDSGNVVIKLIGTVVDIAGNSSETMNVGIDCNITLRGTSIEKDGITYTFTKNRRNNNTPSIGDFTNPTYFNAGDSITVTKKETNENEGTPIEGIIPENKELSKMKYMKLNADTKFEFTDEDKSGDNSYINIEAANIWFDTKAPTMTIDARVETPKNVPYTAGDEIIIIATASEILQESENKPEINVNFSVSGLGKYNYQGENATTGNAKYIETVTTDNKTQYIYKYIVQNGDEGKVSLTYTLANRIIKDIAGNETQLKGFTETTHTGEVILTGKLPDSQETDVTYKLFKNNNQLTNFSSNTYFKAGDKIKVEVTTEKALYSSLGTDGDIVITAEKAPKLKINGISSEIGAKSVNGNKITYEYVIKEADSDAQLSKLILKANVRLFIKKQGNDYDTLNAGNIINTTDITNANLYIHKNTSSSFVDSDITVDTHAPVVTITNDADKNPTNQDPITYTFTWNEEVEGFAADDIEVNGGTIEEFNTVENKKEYTAKVKTSVAGGDVSELKVAVKQNAVRDLAGFGNTREENSITIDKKAPIAEIIADKDNIQKDDIINYTINWSETVNGFEAEDIIVTNGTIEEFNKVVNSEDKKYTLKVKSSNGNDITVEVKENSCTDMAGNTNKAFKHLINVRPTVRIFAIPMLYDFNLDGDVNVDDATTIQKYINQSTRNQLTADQIERVELFGDLNDSSKIDNDDAIYLQKVITEYRDVKPINTNEIMYLFKWSEQVKDFTKDKVIVNGGNKGDLSAPIVNETDGTVIYKMIVTSSIPEENIGQINVAVEQDSVRDLIGNGNIRAENIFTVDKKSPTAEIRADKDYVKKDDTITYTINWSEDIKGFVKNDITVTNGTSGNFTKINNRQYTLEVTPTNGNDVTVEIKENVCVDFGENGNKACKHRIAVVPTVVITTNTTNPTKENEITYTFTWSEEVNGFDLDDIIVPEGAIASKVDWTGNSNVYKLKVNYNSVIPKGNQGEVTLAIKENAIQDNDGNGNAYTNNTLKIDRIAPILISLEAYGDSNIKVNEVDTVKQYYKAGDTVTVIATFSENIEGSTAPTLNLEFSESGNAKGRLMYVVPFDGNKIKYIYEIANDDNGKLSVKGFSGTVTDAAGNETVVTKRTLDGDTIIADTKAPELVSLTAIAPKFEYNDIRKYTIENIPNGETVLAEDSVRYGMQSKTRNKNTITIIAEYSENIYNLSSNNIKKITDDSNSPTLILEFSESGTAKGNNGKARFAKIEENKIYYTYDITSGDNGDISIKSLTGKVSDLAGNELTITNTTLPTVTKYEVEIKNENEVNEIVADTTKPSYTITATAVNKDDKLNDISGNGSYYRKGSIITITAKTNELIYKNSNKELTWFTKDNAPRLTVKFGDIAGKGNVNCTDVQYSGNNTIFTYEYEIKEDDNGTLTATIVADTGYDIALNGNGEKVKTISNIIADTVNPVTNWQSWVESEAYGIKDNGNGTWTVTFSETMYVYNDNTHKVGNALSNSNKSSAPILLVSNDNTTPLETTISNIATTNGKTVITYTYSPYTRNIGAYGMKFASVSDKAGNLFNFKDQVPPVLSSIKVTEPETGTYKAGTEVTIVANFSEKLTGTAPVLKLKFGDTAANGIVSPGIIEDNTITYKYTITDGDNGRLNILSYTGTELKDLYDNKWVAPETISISGNSITADTIAPKVIITANEERTNKDKVIYTFTWDEDVDGFTSDDIETVNGSKGTFTKVSGKVYTLEVDTTNEGRQIVKVPAGVCTDIAGNYNVDRATYNKVVIDYTKPVVRAKINGGKYVIDEDSNKSTLKEIIVVNEEILKFEYTWSDEDTIPENGWTIYPNVDNITVNSDIPLATSVDSEGTYYLYMKVTDKAGNVFKGRTNGFVVSNDTITLTPNTTESTNQDITVTVSYGTQTTGLTQERRAGIQGMSQSADPTKVILKENGVVYAEAKDIAGNKVYETLEINNIDKTAPTAEITYNTNEDGSVTATITLSDGRVTNNEGKTTYTFNENGEFTFEYEDALGNKGTATAKVTTIDKHEDPQPEPQPEPQPTDEDNTAPEITFNYSTTSATVGTKIGSAITTNEDAKISYKWNNGQWKTSSDYIRSYNITYTPATAGTYTLYAKAEDKAGNVTDEKALVFTVVNSQEDIKDPEIEFNDLTVIQKNGVKYVKVSPTYTVEELNAKINKEKLLGVTPTFAKLTSAGKLRTGSEIKLNNTTKYIVIVNGDVNCDGKVDFINDIIMINNYRIGKINNLSEIQILAGDINNSGTIEFISDIISMNNYRLGNINVL